jgi:hypothetical protein
VARKSSHKVVYGREVVLLLNADNCQLIIDLALKRVDRLGSVIEAPTFLVHLSLSFLALLLFRESFSFIPRQISHIEQEPSGEPSPEALRS